MVCGPELARCISEFECPAESEENNTQFYHTIKKNLPHSGVSRNKFKVLLIQSTALVILM